MIKLYIYNFIWSVLETTKFYIIFDKILKIDRKKRDILIEYVKDKNVKYYIIKNHLLQQKFAVSNDFFVQNYPKFIQYGLKKTHL